MASEGLSALAVTDVPQFGCEVTGPWDERVEVRGHTQRHTVTQMTREHRLLRSCLDVPQNTGNRSEVMLLLLNILCHFSLKLLEVNVPGTVSRAGDDLAVIQEAAAGQVTWSAQNRDFKMPLADVKYIIG